MKGNREEILKQFLQSDLLQEASNMSAEELRRVSFAKSTSDVLIEALKRLTISYCQGESDLKILQMVNKEIKQMIEKKAVQS